MIELKKNDFNSFFEVPFQIYQDIDYVSLFKDDLKRFLSSKNPLFRSENDFAYYTAFKDGKPAGRILAHIHHASNELHHWKRGFFGHFDCINDVEVAKELLSKAEGFARERGCDEIMGNFNLTAMQMIGVITKIHVPYHYSDQVFAPEYVAKLLEKCGYSASFPMVTHELDLGNIDTNTMLGPKQKQILRDPDYTFEKLRSDNFEELMESMRVCLNDGFNENPMFVPLTNEELYFQAKDLMLVVDKRISVVAKFKGNPVGVLICIPNLNPFLKNTRSRLGVMAPYYFIKHKLKCDSAVIVFYSVFRDFHARGLNGTMMWEVISSLQKAGYKKLGGTWISLDNIPSIKQAEKLKPRIMHETCLFRKGLEV